MALYVIRTAPIALSMFGVGEFLLFTSEALPEVLVLVTVRVVMLIDRNSVDLWLQHSKMR